MKSLPLELLLKGSLPLLLLLLLQPNCLSCHNLFAKDHMVFYILLWLIVFQSVDNCFPKTSRQCVNWHNSAADCQGKVMKRTNDLEECCNSDTNNAILDLFISTEYSVTTLGWLSFQWHIPVTLIVNTFLSVLNLNVVSIFDHSNGSTSRQAGKNAHCNHSLPKKQTPPQALLGEKH